MFSIYIFRLVPSGWMLKEWFLDSLALRFDLPEETFHDLLLMPVRCTFVIERLAAAAVDIIKVTRQSCRRFHVGTQTTLGLFDQIWDLSRFGEILWLHHHILVVLSLLSFKASQGSGWVVLPKIMRPWRSPGCWCSSFGVKHLGLVAQHARLDLC